MGYGQAESAQISTRSMLTYMSTCVLLGAAGVIRDSVPAGNVVAPVLNKVQAQTVFAGPVQVVSCIAAAVAALASLYAIWQSLSMFRRMRRPWLCIELFPLLEPRLTFDPGTGKFSAKYTVRNCGLGAAWKCRLKSSATASEKSEFADKTVWSDRADAPGQELMLAAGTVTPWDIVAGGAPVAGDAGTKTYIHICCDFSGCETAERYYLEQVFAVTFVVPIKAGTHPVQPVVTYMGRIVNSVVRLEQGKSR